MHTKIAGMNTLEKHPFEHLEDAVSGRRADRVLDEIAASARQAASFVIVSHVNPDGDALGSQVALALALRSLGKTVRVPCAREYPEKFRPLLPAGLLDVREDAAGLEPGDVCFVLDTGDPERTGPFSDFVVKSDHLRICLDHHPVQGPPAQDGFGFDRQLIVPTAPSTGNLVLGLIDRLGVDVSPEIGRALWLAVATDTGWFRFANTDSWALRDAARLAETGLRVEALYQQVYADYTPERARILGSVLAGVRSELGGRLIWSALSRRQYAPEGVRIADMDGMVDHLKSVRGAEVIALIVEVDGGVHKVSLRAPGEAEVASIARHFGGGGHAKAAGYRVSGTPLEGIVASLIRKVEESAGKDPSGCVGSGDNREVSS